MDFFIIYIIVSIGFNTEIFDIIIIKHNHAVYYKPNSVHKFYDLANCSCPIYILIATIFYKLFTVFLAVPHYNVYFTGCLNSQSVGNYVA